VKNKVGRIKGTIIKNVAKELMKKGGSQLSSEFNENKKKLNEWQFKGTKAERNKIAGYITKKIKTQKKYEAEENELQGPAAPVQQRV